MAMVFNEATPESGCAGATAYMTRHAPFGCVIQGTRTSCDKEGCLLVMYGTVIKLHDGGRAVGLSGKSGREQVARTIQTQSLFIA